MRYIATLSIVIGLSLSGLGVQEAFSQSNAPAPIIIQPAQPGATNKSSNQKLNNYSIITTPAKQQTQENASGKAGFKRQAKVKQVNPGQIDAFPSKDDVDYLNVLIESSSNKSQRANYAPTEASTQFATNLNGLKRQEVQRFANQMAQSKQEVEQGIAESEAASTATGIGGRPGSALRSDGKLIQKY